MGAIIQGIRTRSPEGSPASASSTDLAGRAARDLLADCGVAPEDLDLLVNTGVYRDEAICEPAMAAIIQRAYLARRESDDLGTFSFDLNNGACGMLSAFQVVDSFLRARTRRLGLVVTSDVDPTPAVSQGYPFAPCGAAVLLRPGSPDEGFSAFHAETFGRHSGLFEGRGEWCEGRAAVGMVIREGEAYAERCAECATAALGRFLERERLAPSELDLIVASPSPTGFAARLLETAGLPEERMVTAPDRVHTAGPALALERALAGPRPCDVRNLLFVTVGAGVTVSLALYRVGAEMRLRSGATARGASR